MSLSIKFGRDSTTMLYLNVDWALQRQSCPPWPNLRTRKTGLPSMPQETFEARNMTDHTSSLGTYAIAFSVGGGMDARRTNMSSRKKTVRFGPSDYNGPSMSCYSRRLRATEGPIRPYPSAACISAASIKPL